MSKLDAIKKVVYDFFTEADGKTWDLGRAAWAFGIVSYVFGVTPAAALLVHSINLLEWAGGFAGLLAAGGVMIWTKDKEKIAVPDLKIPFKNTQKPDDDNDHPDADHPEGDGK